jgi:hypothetical protein
LKSYGYEYRSQCVWLKDDEGADAWFHAYEPILVCVRGVIPPPAPEKLLPSVIKGLAKRGGRADQLLTSNAAPPTPRRFQSNAGRPGLKHNAQSLAGRAP